MASNTVPKPKTENAWQVWQVSPIVISIHLLLPLLLCYYLPKFLEKAAIPAIVLYSPDK
jgi:hypothetical protein